MRRLWRLRGRPGLPSRLGLRSEMGGEPAVFSPIYPAGIRGKAQVTHGSQAPKSGSSPMGLFMIPRLSEGTCAARRNSIPHRPTVFYICKHLFICAQHGLSCRRSSHRPTIGPGAFAGNPSHKPPVDCARTSLANMLPPDATFLAWALHAICALIVGLSKVSPPHDSGPVWRGVSFAG